MSFFITITHLIKIQTVQILRFTVQAPTHFDYHYVTHTGDAYMFLINSLSDHEITYICTNGLVFGNSIPKLIKSLIKNVIISGVAIQ